MVELEIKKQYEKFRLDVAFKSVKKRIGILGASGCGKSLTLKSIAGIERPEKGRIVIDGVILFDAGKVGYLFQNYALFPNMTVEQNIGIGFTGNKEDKQKMVEQLIHHFQLNGLEKLYPSKLSGGQQQRTALARAIANNPPILICDEPTGNLDPETAYGIMKLLDDINKRGTTIVMATHARDIVDAMQKRVVTLHKGHIIRDIEKGGYSDEA